ncbi:MAG: ribosomal-processing cysteine protease Prp [Bacillota bacterium]
MIKISVVRDKEGFIWQYIVEGHAGFAEEGKDLVCAAVSVVAFMGINALDELAGLKRNYGFEHGYMLCSVPTDIPEEKKEKVKTILETIVVGFKQIELTYEDYVSVLEEEV